MNKHLYSVVLVMGMMALAVGSADSEELGSDRNATGASGKQQSEAGNVHRDTYVAPRWFEGGTLHNGTALDWQNASQRNRLATVADFVAVLWQEGQLKPSISVHISSVDDMRPLVDQMVEYLNAAFMPDSDPVVNAKTFQHVSIKKAAAIGAFQLGWAED